MGHFYNPPGPYVGGRQPYDPGRRRDASPPQNPPFGHPAKRQLALYHSIRTSWEPPPPQPQRLLPTVTASGPVKTPYPITPNWLQTVQQAWQPAAPTPQRDVTVATPSGPDNPPPLQTEWQTNVLAAWQQQYPQPQTLDPIAALIPAGGADNPPFTYPARNVEQYIRTYDPDLWKRGVSAGRDDGPWLPPPPPPDDPPPFSRAVPLSIIAQWDPPVIVELDLSAIPSLPDNGPPRNDAWIDVALRAWEPLPPMPVQRPAKLRAESSIPPVVDNPPPFSIVEMMQAVLQWQPGPPQPKQGVRNFPFPTYIPDNPPVRGVSSQQIILRAWEPPPPQPWHPLPSQQIDGPNPPPPPPPDDAVPERYGPALTPAQRRRWFSDTNPIERAAKRKEKERQQRVELGIIKEVAPPAQAKADAPRAPQELPALPAVDRAAADARTDRITKRMAAIERLRNERLEEEEEVSEIIEVIKGILQ